MHHLPVDCWSNIAIALIDPQKSETKAQACNIAWLQQQSLISRSLRISGRVYPY